MDSYYLLNFTEKNEFTILQKGLIISSKQDLKVGDQVSAKKTSKSDEKVAVICFIGKPFLFFVCLNFIFIYSYIFPLSRNIPRLHE